MKHKFSGLHQAGTSGAGLRPGSIPPAPDREHIETRALIRAPDFRDRPRDPRGLDGATPSWIRLHPSIVSRETTIANRAQRRSARDSVRCSARRSTRRSTERSTGRPATTHGATSGGAWGAENVSRETYLAEGPSGGRIRTTASGRPHPGPRILPALQRQPGQPGRNVSRGTFRISVSRGAGLVVSLTGCQPGQYYANFRNIKRVVRDCQGGVTCSRP